MFVIIAKYQEKPNMEFFVRLIIQVQRMFINMSIIYIVECPSGIFRPKFYMFIKIGEFFEAH